MCSRPVPRCLLLGLLAVLPVLLVAPAVPATAAPVVPTSLTIAADPTRVPHGGSSTVSTVLTANGSGVPDQTVQLQRQTFDGWAVVTSRVTDAGGAASVSVSAPPLAETYRWAFAGSGIFQASLSPTVTVSSYRPTVLDIAANPGSITAGGSSTIGGTLQRDNTFEAVAGEEVLLEQSADGIVWEQAGSDVTDAGGHISLVVSPATTTHYRWRYPGGGLYGGSQSAPVEVTVTEPAASTLTITASETLVSHCNTTILTGTLTYDGAPVVGATVILQRSDDGGATWSPPPVPGSDHEATTDANGYLELEGHACATRLYRWHFPGTTTYPAAISPTVTIEVIPGSETSLTITASEDQVGSGQPVVLGTTLTSGSGEPLAGHSVTLQSSTQPFDYTDVTTVTTDATGHAEATVTPTENTTYRWVHQPTPDHGWGASDDLVVTVTDSTATTVLIAGETLHPRITYGEQTQVEGWFEHNGTATAGQPLVLESSTDGGATWTAVATETSGDNVSPGHVSHFVTPSRTTAYRWRFAGAPGLDPATSETLTVGVRRAVTLRVSDTSPAVGDVLVARGKVTPDAAGLTVRVLRISQTGQRTKFRTGTVAADGSYEVKRTVGNAGKFLLVAKVGATSTHLPGGSREIAVKVG